MSAVWLGASEVSKGVDIDGEIDAWTGDPELVDHLKVVTAQLFTGRIFPSDYIARTDLSWPGIKEAIEFASQYGVSPGTFLEMKETILYRMAAIAQKKVDTA